MKLILTAGLLAFAASFACSAAPPARAPGAAASAASQPVNAARTAAKAAQDAEVPGDVRPENPVVPQLSIPLKRERSKELVAAPKSGNAVGGVDDGAARCRAMKTSTERTECQRALASSAKP
jgi:hypothetical protein